MWLHGNGCKVILAISCNATSLRDSLLRPVDGWYAELRIECEVTVLLTILLEDCGTRENPMKLRVVKILAALLASTLFFVVSCTGSTIVASKVMVELDTRDIVAGDPPHRPFYVLAVTPETTRPVSLDRLTDYLDKNKSASLLLTPGIAESPGYSDGMDTGTVHYAYTATGKNEQSVELQVTDYDLFNGTYHYRVQDGAVTPTYSKQIHYFKMVAQSLPYGLGIALLLYSLGKLMNRQVKRQEKPG